MERVDFADRHRHLLRPHANAPTCTIRKIDKATMFEYVVELVALSEWHDQFDAMIFI